MNLTFVSIIIPVYNASPYLHQCLTAIEKTQFPQWECIVVNDCSTDDSVSIATSYSRVKVIETAVKSGPAIARNLGATIAQGELLFFIDADVEVQPGTVGHAVATMQAHPELAACFGSYDNTPPATNFLSQYRNLQHHYVHQTSQNSASTFWSGCGIIRKSNFTDLGGFRSLTAGRPSIEDIELGHRLHHAGYDIRLEKLLLVKHLKRWRLSTMLLTDIRDRAWPWTRLIVQQGNLPDDLNLQLSQRISTVAVFAGLTLLFLSISQPLWLVGVIGILAILVRLNRAFYTFFLRKKGVWFTIRAMMMHWLYFLYSGLTFGAGIFYWGILRQELFSTTGPNE